MIKTSINFNRRVKRLRTDNGTIEISGHFLNCSHSNGIDCNQEIKFQISSHCLKVMDDIQVGDLEACRSSESGGGSAIEQDGVRKRNPGLKDTNHEAAFESLCFGFQRLR